MRLIDRQAAIEVVEDAETMWLKGEIDIIYPTVIKRLRGLPTIDAVPVVRCKDCKHRYRDCVGGAYDDWFCTDGERKYNDNH